MDVLPLPEAHRESPLPSPDLLLLRSGTVVSLSALARSSSPQLHHPYDTLLVHNMPQSVLFKDNNLWQAAESGNLLQLMQFSTEPLIVSNKMLGLRGEVERGSNGETILHVACLHGHAECIRWISLRFPGLVNEVYRKGRFEGETALHLAVVKSDIGDTSMVEFLVQHGYCYSKCTISAFRITHSTLRCRARVNGPRATGKEFKNLYYENQLSPNRNRTRIFSASEVDHGRFYYGQTVLHFAAASSKVKILQYLIENEHDPADLTSTDQYGNNVLHILAYHGIFKNFDYIRNRNDQDIRKGITKIDLMNVRNRDDLTPLQVGIARGFTEALDQLKQEVFKFGMETTFRVSIDILDPLIENQTTSILRETGKSGIELAVINKDKNIVAHPIIDTLLKWKWTLYARKIFLFRFMLMWLLTLSIVVSISLQPASLFERRSYSTSTVTRAFFESLAMISSLATMFWEIHGFSIQYTFSKSQKGLLYTVKDFGTQIFHYLTGSEVHEKVLLWLCALLILTTALLRFATVYMDFDSALNIENLFLGIAAIFSCICLMSYSQGFSSVGPLVIVVKRIIRKDLLEWMWVYLLITTGFSCAMYLQMQSSDVDNWSTFISTFVSSVRFILSEANYDDMAASRIPVCSKFLFVVYLFTSIVLLANVLIAKLVDTYQSVSTDSKR
ncbi:hypothetical protein HDU82_008425, partial [Entophlyctis luteolus]